MARILKTTAVKILSLPIYFYRYAISPLLRPSCRHVPSCSQYALDALRIHGPACGFANGNRKDSEVQARGDSRIRSRTQVQI